MQNYHSPPPTSRLMPILFPSKSWLALKTPSFPFYCWAWHYMVWNISLVTQGSCQVVKPLGNRERSRKGLDAGHWSANTRTLVCYQDYFALRSKTQNHMRCLYKTNPVLARPVHWHSSSWILLSGFASITIGNF